MTEAMLSLIREAGAVPPPPDRAAALTRAMAAVQQRTRRLRTTVVAIAATMVLAIPAGMIQAGSQDPALPSPRGAGAGAAVASLLR